MPCALLVDGCPISAAGAAHAHSCVLGEERLRQRRPYRNPPATPTAAPGPRGLSCRGLAPTAAGRHSASHAAKPGPAHSCSGWANAPHLPQLAMVAAESLCNHVLVVGELRKRASKPHSLEAALGVPAPVSPTLFRKHAGASPFSRPRASMRQKPGVDTNKIMFESPIMIVK